MGWNEREERGGEGGAKEGGSRRAGSGRDGAGLAWVPDQSKGMSWLVGWAGYKTVCLPRALQALPEPACLPAGPVFKLSALQVHAVHALRLVSVRCPCCDLYQHLLPPAAPAERCCTRNHFLPAWGPSQAARTPHAALHTHMCALLPLLSAAAA